MYPRFGTISSTCDKKRIHKILYYGLTGKEPRLCGLFPRHHQNDPLSTVGMRSCSLNSMLISPPKQHNNSGNIQTAQDHYCYYGNVSFGLVFNFGSQPGQQPQRHQQQRQRREDRCERTSCTVSLGLVSNVVSRVSCSSPMCYYFRLAEKPNNTPLFVNLYLTGFCKQGTTYRVQGSP